MELITTSNIGGELVSFIFNGEERIHQGEKVLDENGRVYWKRHAPVLFPIVGKLRRNQTYIGGKTYDISQHRICKRLRI